MNAVSLKCPNCNKSFSVLEDERFDHSCPNCDFAGRGASDYYGDEILSGDSIVISENGEIILEENLEDYLIEILGFRFSKAK
ncbi:MAG: YqaI family protein [Bacillota bacterium]